jgi:putative phage-type endonuclease
MGVGLRTPYQLWREKTGLIPSPDLQHLPRVYWGTKLEDVIAAEFAERHSTWAVRRRRQAIRSKRPEWQFALAHLDRTVRDGAMVVPLEVKTSQDFDQWESGIPDYYVPQIQHQLAVTDAPYAYVAVLLSGYDYRERVVRRDEAYIDELMDREARFWHLVTTREEPALTVSDVIEKYPAPEAASREADSAIGDVAMRARALDTQIKASTVGYEALKDQIAAFLGDADTLTIDGKSIATFKRKVSKRISPDLVREKAPDVIDAVTVESATREFRWVK